MLLNAIVQCFVADGEALLGVGLEQLRAYANVSLIPDRLEYYVDENLAPGNAQPHEYYGRYSDPTHGWYINGRASRLPLP